jgi:hypothetical protein
MLKIRPSLPQICRAEISQHTRAHIMSKLFVIHALEAPIAVIFRRGPSKWYHLISWNTQTDEMQHGAWIKGHIHEDKCNLSFDGELLVYFVHKEGHHPDNLPNSWTALSRPPWLTALALWPQGDTYYGGGRFTGQRKVALRPICKGWGDTCHPDFPNTYVKIDQGIRPDVHRTADLVADAHWSGYDLQGRVIFTRGDKLLRIDRPDGVEKEVADFSDLTPDPQPSPKWARSFPSR